MCLIGFSRETDIGRVFAMMTFIYNFRIGSPSNFNLVISVCTCDHSCDVVGVVGFEQVLVPARQISSLEKLVEQEVTKAQKKVTFPLKITESDSRRQPTLP